MGKNNSVKRAEQLGMSYGTAANRLKKNLMFKFAQELGKDDCYACGEKIETPSDLSVEHIEPWEGRENGTEKFWDLDNIAFSHLKCNVKHTSSRRERGSEEAWCNQCNDFRPKTEFHLNSTNWSGVQQVCKYHRNKRQVA